MKLVSSLYRALSDFKDVQAGLALFWWQILITFVPSRIRVRTTMTSMCGTLKTTGEANNRN